MQKIQKIYAADFETTVDDEPEAQIETEVWSAAICEIYTENVIVYNNLDDFMKFVFSTKSNKLIYFHNLKFDGSFIVPWLLLNGYEFRKEKLKPDRYSRIFNVNISEKNRWYSLSVVHRGRVIEFRDSAKLYPMPLEKAGESFQTKYRKLEMEYKGHISGGVISAEEMNYIKNDVLVLKELIEIAQNEGHTGITIGSCCMEEYKQILKNELHLDIDFIYPKLNKFPLDIATYGAANVDLYCRKALKGGFCYVNPTYAEKMIEEEGITFDVTSLYPSMQHSMSGNIYPVGKPTMWKGNYIPDEAKLENKVFIVRFKATFTLREDKLPCVQIKNDFMYKPNVWLDSSDFFYKGKRFKTFINDKGEEEKKIPELTMTSVDYYLFLDNYYVDNFEILDGVYFYGFLGLFDKYVDKYIAIKNNSKGAKREVSKLFLNNLWGKASTSDNSSYLIPYLDVEGVLQFDTVEEHNRDTLNVAMGAFTTAYARRFTITNGQSIGLERFCYSDTDSLHILKSYGGRSDLGSIVEAENKLCTWKREADWSKAIFIRQKTYAEYVDGDWEITCAGMKERTKQYLKEIGIENFKYGFCAPPAVGNLKPKRIRGGTVLVDCKYELRK